MLTSAPNWRGTSLNSIFGTRGLSGFRRRGMSAVDTSGPDVVDISGLVPQYGPDANVVAPLQIGQLAQQVSASGAYSINPATGQLQANMIPGISNSTLMWVGGGALAFVLLIGIARGRR